MTSSDAAISDNLGGKTSHFEPKKFPSQHKLGPDLMEGAALLQFFCVDNISKMISRKISRNFEKNQQFPRIFLDFQTLLNITMQ